MEVANTLAYYETATITIVRGFIVQAPQDFANNELTSKSPNSTPKREIKIIIKNLFIVFFLNGLHCAIGGRSIEIVVC